VKTQLQLVIIIIIVIMILIIMDPKEVSKMKLKGIHEDED
jgi:hypothetical protein